ncbi:MAG TPA: HYR domain-containing protein, partial [Thermoanaerobaculia bacterium]|nr:HYR domain-containing protein [Thermoanaerobaculia bacterium]
MRSSLARSVFVIAIVCATGSLFAATLHLPAHVTAEATGPNGAAVSFDASGTPEGPDDENGRPISSASVVCAPASGNVFAVGTTTVHCTATDDNQSSTGGSFTVTVRDTTGPALQLPSAISIQATSSTGAFVSYSASANDLVDGAVSVQCSPASGSQFAAGTTTVSCAASDTRGNQSSGSFEVVVTSQPPPPDPPAPNLPGDITAE